MAEAEEGYVHTYPDGTQIIKMGGQWEPYRQARQLPGGSGQGITMEKAGPFARQMAYEGTGGTIGGILGTPAGPLGTALGIGLGTGIGHVADRIRGKMAGEEVSPLVPQGMLETGQTALLAPTSGKLGEIAGAAIRHKIGPKGLGQEATDRLARMERAGVPPNLPAVSQKPTHRLAWEAGRRYPFASEVTEEYSERAAKALGARAQEIGGGGGRGMYGAGRAMREGAEDTRDKFLARANAMADDVAKSVPDDLMVDISQYRNVLQGPMRKFSPAQSKAYGNTKFGQRYEALVEDYGILNKKGDLVGFHAMPWKEANAIRGVVGEEIGDTSGRTLQDVSVRELKKAYAAISDDLAKGLTAQQSKAWAQQKTYFRRGAKVIGENVDWILKNKRPEAFAEAISRGKYSEARRVLGAVPAKYRNIMREEVVHNMGLAKAGAQDVTGEVFSPNTFLTNYNKLDVGTRKLLFGRDKAGLKALDDLAGMVSDFKAMGQVYNYSGTAGASKAMEIAEKGYGVAALTMLYFDPLVASALSGGSAGLRASAKLMTKPSFVKWLVKGAEYSPRSMGAAEHIARLSGLAGLEGSRHTEELQAWLKDFINPSTGLLQNPQEAPQPAP